MSDQHKDMGADKGQDVWSVDGDSFDDAGYAYFVMTADGTSIARCDTHHRAQQICDDHNNAEAARRRIAALEAAVKQSFRWFDEWLGDEMPPDAVRGANAAWLACKQALTDAPQQG